MQSASRSLKSSCRSTSAAGGAPYVRAYQALRGVQFHVASTVAAELGDITRFERPRQLAAYVGLHPRSTPAVRVAASGGSRRPVTAT